MPTTLPLRRNLVLSLAATAAAPWLLTSARGATLAEPPRVPPALLLPNVYGERIDPSLYLVSEKLDGVRGVWDGEILRFRSGRLVPAPAWFTARLPRLPLDGELWLGRGRFDELSGLVRSDPADAVAWRKVRYVAFELPGGGGRFEQRARQLASLAQRTGWPQFAAAAQTTVSDHADLQRRLADTVARGGEGLVLHLASAPIVTGRSDVLLKLKPERDTEATVVAYRAGKGKYVGQVGALEVRSPEGLRFSIGSGLSDELRRQPPPIGSVITYRYRDLTPGGLPRFASYLRIHDGL